uniref:Uncharacterized protein n=1 Tax=viral metagenome TaxID=1070528 RepID=A0A6M3LP15_9ZZZZ
MLEFWEMTQKQFGEMILCYGPDFTKKITCHKSYVEQAIREGKPISDNVLKDYPDLSLSKKEKIIPFNRFEEQCLHCECYIENTEEEVLDTMTEAGIDCSYKRNCYIPFKCNLFQDKED